MNSVPEKPSLTNGGKRGPSEKSAAYSLLNGIYVRWKSYESSSGPMINMGIDAVTNPEPTDALRMEKRFARKASRMRLTGTLTSFEKSMVAAAESSTTAWESPRQPDQSSKLISWGAR